jgi:nucleoside-diphosphate-sugar epimerase
MADAVGKIVGRKPDQEFAPPRPGELRRNSLVIDKARNGLRWTPVHRFEDGLEQLVNWFKQGAP